MLRLVGAQFVHRRARTLALLLGILVATTSFTVLTGTSATSRLQVRGTVERNFRGSYDILVRPRGSRTVAEARSGLLAPNFVSDVFGGITLDQWRAIRRVPGVEVAAPIANIGYALVPVDVPVRVPSKGRGRQLFRIRTSWVSDRGHTQVADADHYVYVTPHRLQAPEDRGVITQTTLFAPKEVLDDGRVMPICERKLESEINSSPWDLKLRRSVECFSSGRIGGAPGRGIVNGVFQSARPRATVRWTFPVLIAAVDPASEARLDGLGRAVTAGRLLRAGDAPRSAGYYHSVPVVAATRPYIDETLSVEVQRLASGDANRMAERRSPARLQQFLNTRPPGRIVTRTSVDASDAWTRLLRTMHRGGGPVVDTYWTTRPPTFGQQDPLVPQTVHNNPADAWLSAYQGSIYAQAPMTARDRAFRAVTPYQAANSSQAGGTAAALRAVGVFDPLLLPGFARRSSLTVQAFTEPGLTGADTTARDALAGRPLLHNGNLAGYPGAPPLVLTNLNSLHSFTGANYPGRSSAAPISAVRVRVAGVRGADAASRERVRLAAQRIAGRTGLAVDVMLGASVSPQRVELPAGRFGRPPLALTEDWMRKGVATAILRAVDRKSLILFALILVVCALFVSNAAAAAVRTRRTELGILACLGWSASRLFAAILIEVGAIGVVAGGLGGLLALPVAALLNVEFSVTRAALAIPAALALAVAAALVPALRAARSQPIAATQPAVLTVRRARSPRNIAMLALTNVLRVPGRSALGAMSLAIGVCALTLLLAATVGFRDELVGSLLGDTIAVDVRSTDYIAAIATIVLGAAAVTDVLFLGIRERADELATLRATGWDDRALIRLITYEGLAIGIAGSLLGAGLGLAGAASFAGALPASLVQTTLAAVAAGTLAAAAAVIAPAIATRRLPLAPVLAGE